MVDKKIDELIEKYGKILIVFKGFSKIDLPSKNKYFSFSLDNIDLLSLETIEDNAVKEILKNFDDSSPYKWMTMEEYQLVKEYKRFINCQIIVLNNNLFYKQYPYIGNISDIEGVYRKLYYTDDSELSSQDERLYELITKFYGQIDYSKECDNYYVTYHDDDDLIVVDLYDQILPDKLEFISSDDYWESPVQRVELSENEIPFLDLENKLLANENTGLVLFEITGDVDNLPYNYLLRLDTLEQLFGLKFKFVTQSIQRQYIENSKEYHSILKSTYGYDNFREIEIYRDIKSHSRDIIKVSQMQIIDDIVQQSERAMNGDAFQDIFITASTGAGKSVMFQIPALYLSQKYPDKKPLTLVISPLIGLMNDQVDNLKGIGVCNAATINGNTPPFEKERILAGVQEKTIDILYLSPETMQARSDIRMLIGDREIGVVIIDEAHIVTTWGKSFRADYWYLGIYLAKLRKEYKFPIVTFTATAIYGGREDMYLDTRTSLNMVAPITYFGKVRRDDVFMKVRSSCDVLEDEGRDYRKTKHFLTLKHMKDAYQKKQKSLIYFPTVRLLNDFYNFIEQNIPDISKATGKYYGTLSKEEKDEVLNAYKCGELEFVLATKAFGMGIDIPDITNVYHYAPTGNVVDYIQEIGRVARNKTLVPYGFGIIDFLPNDMNDIKQLYGMSAIRKNQITAVMEKILTVYKKKGNHRNLIISPEDFKHIFVQNKRDEDSLDNKVKTVLLMIEKDFSSPQKLGYSPFVARPRSLFGNDLIFVTSDFEGELLDSPLASYVTKVLDVKSKLYSGVYKVNLSNIWEHYYKKMSFPSFKYSLFNEEERKGLLHGKFFKKFDYTSGIEINFAALTKSEEVIADSKQVLGVFESFLRNCQIMEKQFSVIELGEFLGKKLNIADKFEARALAQTLINSAFEYSKIKNINFISERTNSSTDKQLYRIHQGGDIFTNFIIDELTKVCRPKDSYFADGNILISFYRRSNDKSISSKLTALSIPEARKLLTYQLVGGDNPQIYLRINSIYPLEKAIKLGDKYQNTILSDVQIKHYTSVAMLKYLFTKPKEGKTPKEQILNYTKWFWDCIEDYFMGIVPEEVKKEVSRII